MSLADYLAQNYLNPDKKKKKRKAESSSTIIVADAAEWDHPQISDEEPEGEGPVRIESAVVTRESRGWKNLETGKILKTPRIVEGVVTMANGAVAGLQTGQAVEDSINQKQADELHRMLTENPDLLGKDSATIYRDASGRRVDVAMKRAELRAQMESDARAKEAIQRSINTGAVQLIEQEEERAQLEKAKTRPLNRYAGDKELNDELRQKERYEDPAFNFLPSATKDARSKTGRKLYKGSYPANRFSIPPGYKWDGVDRSNGFEEQWYKKQNEVIERKTLSYTMQEEY
ncbi:hypothetical protein BABINDRAFT_162198 [Babjeviella inositovora NRRL Y-12698]|uniref:Pre-mRNA-splicing factor CWC26 n=1 Tax=Babjeviella inositovora NRRL Y-12698 TaxID=984486 RepID=A0A1E3QN56_9ASCO|nr:uncharacterized protein BABINDRAFT_162198 [Babjeviella inositovora NRRL Y-12698]ODQ79139.1 hypothetical protein BABINDRAFT_162198 [Babjeviella inositovora NRRL Y-12698]